MTAPLLPTIDSPAAGSPYVGYSYAYPHKTAYRSLSPPIDLRQLWAEEDTSALFLYLHIPFCEHRCGFCNLFTQANPDHSLTRRYVAQLRREAEIVGARLGPAAFARLAVGGGTPTFLDPSELNEVFEIAETTLGATPHNVPVSVETSPATVDEERLAVLRSHGADRISIGVQSFDDDQSHGLGRPQRRTDVERALTQIRDFGFPVLNIDLMYGGSRQPVESVLESVREAIGWQAEEVYLYPLYVRPLTGLGVHETPTNDNRLMAYRSARDTLLSAGYEQVSMRMFRRIGTADVPGPVYCCQSDGMVGVGCGARSYTRALHYSTEYAVGRRGVQSILADYIGRDPQLFATARHGYQLDEHEERRRFVIMSLLQQAGLQRDDYCDRFGADVFVDLPQLELLTDLGLAVATDTCLSLTSGGMERSDCIGPWLYSDAARQLMNDYELR